jgi:hypothetical protein
MGLFSSILDFASSDVGGAALQIGGSILASGLGASAAERAAGMQTAATQEAIAEHARQFDITQANLAPFIDAATRGIVSQQAGVGLLGPEAQQLFFEEFRAGPGQEFLRRQQEQALLRQQAALGGIGGGRVRTALQEQAANRATLDFQNQLNRLAAISGTGQTAATQLGQIGAGTAQNIGALLTTQGQAGAAGVLGQQAAIQQGISGVAQAVGGLF